MIERATYNYVSDTGVWNVVTLEVDTQHAAPYLLEFFQEYLNQPRATNFEVARYPRFSATSDFKGEKILSIGSHAVPFGHGEATTAVSRTILVR